MTREAFSKKHKADLEKNVTVGMLLEYTDNFLIPAMSNLMDVKLKESEGRMDQKLKGLEGRMDQKLKESNARLSHDLKSYIDDKMADYTSDIFKRLERIFQRDLAFKEKVVSLLKKHKIGTTEEIAFLEGMISES